MALDIIMKHILKDLSVKRKGIIIHLENTSKSYNINWSLCILTESCLRYIVLVPNKALCVSTALTFSFMSLQQRHRHSTLSNIPNTQHSILATGSYHVLLVGMSIDTVQGHSVTSPFVGDTMTSNMLSSRIYLCIIHETCFPLVTKW